MPLKQDLLLRIQIWGAIDRFRASFAEITYKFGTTNNVNTVELNTPPMLVNTPAEGHLLSELRAHRTVESDDRHVGLGLHHEATGRHGADVQQKSLLLLQTLNLHTTAPSGVGTKYHSSNTLRRPLRRRL